MRFAVSYTPVSYQADGNRYFEYNTHLRSLRVVLRNYCGGSHCVCPVCKLE